MDRKTPITDFQTAPTFVYFFPNVSPQDSIDEDELQSLLDDLIRHGGDALLRMTLRKAPELRTEEDLDFIYNELLHIKALAHLSTMIKRELARVVLLESHSNVGTVCKYSSDCLLPLLLILSLYDHGPALTLMCCSPSSLTVFNQGDEGTSW